jgi:hypothetical protein
MAFLGPSLRRKRVADRPMARAVVAGAISLGVHGLVLVLLVIAGAFSLVRPLQSERVDLAQLSSEQWAENRAIDGQAPPPTVPLPPTVAPPVPAPAPARPPPEPKRGGQVVDTGPGNDRAPDHARFLSERNNSVEKETKSRWAGTELFEHRAATPVPGGAAKKKAGEGGNDAETREAREARGGKGGRQRTPDERTDVAQEGDRVAMADPPRLPAVDPRRWGQAGEGDDEGLGAPAPAQEAQAGSRKAGDANLLPSVESMSQIAAGPSNDAIDDDVEVGDGTALNTRAFRFATFWNRFKQDVSGHWFPAVRYDLTSRDPAGTIFGQRGWLTELRIVLDGSGAVKEVRVTGPSGLDFLDRVAVKSVRDAAPFYNVPPSLLDTKGELAFEFGFLVSDERGTPVRPRYGGGR